MNNEEKILKIKQIWQEIINLEEINIDDDFFSLGGNSIHGMVIIAEINNYFHCAISINNLFANPTITQLANII